MKQQQIDSNLSGRFGILLFVAIVLNASGLFSGLLEGDSALYATTAKYMITRGDWANLFASGSDWLDKPHFPFWVAAVFYKIFGVSAFAYKLSSFIFWLLGLRFTYLLAHRLYNKNVAQMAVLIHAFALHGILSNFDVRAEPLLTALYIGAVYYLYRSFESGKWLFIFPAALLSGCAVMTKGIFILIPIGGGFVWYWLATKQWKQFVNIKWYAFLALTFICILPELYCLYIQFDLHPEKTVFGRTNVSGIRFFLWDSQFGRFFNTGPIKGKGDPFLYVHTTLWAFLPWGIYLFIAAVKTVAKRGRLINPAQLIISGSAAITFLLFSFSKFQLPHYIVILFPQFAMLTASYLATSQSPAVWRRLVITQNIFVVLAAAAVVLLVIISGFGNVWLTVAIAAAGLFFAFISVRGADRQTAFFIKGAVFSGILFLYLNIFFYPNLMQYQSGMMAGKSLRNKKITNETGMFGKTDYGLEFYAPSRVLYLHSPSDSFIRPNNLVYTIPSQIQALTDAGHRLKVEDSFYFFRVTKLNMKFLKTATRQTVLDTVLLCRVMPRAAN